MIESSVPPNEISVLVVEDDQLVGGAIRRVLARNGYGCAWLERADGVLAHLDSHPVDVLVTDLALPGLDGLALLRAVRARRVEIPVVIVTGNPSIESAIEGMELGAVQYLVKPIGAEALTAAVRRAALLGRLARLGREAFHATARPRADVALHDSTRASLERALRSLWMAYQPILDVGTGSLLAYEALMRSREPELPSPPAVLEAAEAVDRLHEVGRRTRALVAEDLELLPPGCLAFVNLHANDLLDDALFASTSPLRPHASRIVLELTERASVESIRDVRDRITALREMGYRIAVDDLGAGYAGLSYFAQLDPDWAKIDMSLIRGIDASATKQRVVLSLIALCRDLGISVIAEGIETAAERRTVTGLGAHGVQGYHIGRPGPAFPQPS